MVLMYGVLKWTGTSAPEARARSLRCSSRKAARSGPAWSSTCSKDSTHSAVSCGLESATLSFRFWCMSTFIIVGEPGVAQGGGAGGFRGYNVVMIRVEQVLDSWRTIRQDTAAAEIGRAHV